MEAGIGWKKKTTQRERAGKARQENEVLSWRSASVLWAWLGSVIVVLAVCCGQMQAQVASGTIIGTITDATGAVIPDSTITATSTTTGAVRRTESDKDGAFSLPSLQPDTYRLTARAKGFGTQVSTVTVLLNQSLRADFKLEVSSASQTVEVQTGVIELETDSHELSSTLGSEMVENLPSLNRDVFSTLDVAPAVASYGSSNGNSDINFFQTGNNSLTIGGTTYGNTGYLQDGVTNYNLLTKTANLQPSPEDVQAVTIQMNGAAARFDNPATVNVVTRGGANKFHGRVYDYLRNDAFDAMGYYSKTKPKLRYNQFGANIGGPIYRNKLLFFFAYDGFRNDSGYTSTALVPSAAERQGDFSADTFKIYDPSTYNPTTHTISQFPGNIIPQSRITQFSQNFLTYIPLPTGSSIANRNYQVNLVPKTVYNNYLGRLDYNIGRADQIYGAIEKNNPTSSQPGFSPSPIFTNVNVQSATNAYVQETHVFDSHLVNIARFGYNLSDIYQKLAGAGTQNFVQQFPLPFVNPDPSQELPPVVSFSRFSGLGGSFTPDGATQKLYEFADEVDKVIGKHSIYFGADVNYITFRASWVIYNNAQLGFNGQYTSDHAAKISGGSDMADFLLGYPSSALGARGYTVGNFKQIYFMPYIQDDWRPIPRLTLNLGMRYDYYQAPSDSRGHSNVYDVTTNTNHPGTYHQSYFNVAPRFGFAYSLDNKSVVRGGYGIYYSPFMYNELQYLIANPPNYTLQSNSFAINNPTPLSAAFDENPTKSALSPFTTSLSMPTPYVQQWNLALQRSLGKNWMTTAAYLGNHLLHAQLRNNPNQAALPTDPNNITPIATRRPYPYIGDVYQATDRGYGNYNALAMELKRRFANGFSVWANWVWSKALDVDSSDNFYPRSSQNLSADYGRADFDRKHVLKVSGVANIPIGSMLSSHLITREVIGGWWTSGSLAYESGTPIGIQARDLSNTGAYHTTYANQSCNGNNLKGRTFAHWFDTSCFTQPGPGVLGNASRNNIIGPRWFSLSNSAGKNFSLGDPRAIQFRADFFSTLNHPQGWFPALSQSVASSAYGEVTSVGGSRVIQLSLKFIY